MELVDDLGVVEAPGARSVAVEEHSVALAPGDFGAFGLLAVDARGGGHHGTIGNRVLAVWTQHKKFHP